MGKTSRHHHYLSQCYLRGFTKSGSKKSKLTVIDLKERKRFESNPRNVGGIRDFNRVEIDGVEPDAVESSLSAFEGEVAAALKKLEQTRIFGGNKKELILNLIALLAVRSPEMRENWRKSFAHTAEIIMDISLATKDRWELQMQKMKNSGNKINENITYEDAKNFHDSKAYTIEVATERHLHIEFVGISAILPYLFQRKWLLISATEESGPFVTTDNPVNIYWIEPEKVPPFYRQNPGYGLKGTQVLFPVSRNLALLGELDGKEGLIEAPKELVAALNSKMLMSMYKQIYSSKIGFYFLGKDGEILEGNNIFKHIST